MHTDPALDPGTGALRAIEEREYAYETAYEAAAQVFDNDPAVAAEALWDMAGRENREDALGEVIGRIMLGRQVDESVKQLQDFYRARARKLFCETAANKAAWRAR